MVEKAKIKIIDTGEEIDAMFNPTDYTISSTGTVKTKKNSKPFFNKVDVDDFVVTLLFDTYEKHGNIAAGTDVRNITKKISSLVMPLIEGVKKKQPPTCLFIWGKFKYKGIIYKVSQKFTMFLPNGRPVRAELTVTFQSVMTNEEYAKNMGIEACRKFWTVKSDERLDLIAHKALKDVTQWRKIADENNINNPLAFPKDEDIGRLLIIPD